MGRHGINSKNKHRHFWWPAHHHPSHKASEIDILSHSLGINCYDYFQGCMVHVQYGALSGEFDIKPRGLRDQYIFSRNIEDLPYFIKDITKNICPVPQTFSLWSTWYLASCDSLWVSTLFLSILNLSRCLVTAPTSQFELSSLNRLPQNLCVFGSSA